MARTPPKTTRAAKRAGATKRSAAAAKPPKSVTRRATATRAKAKAAAVKAAPKQSKGELVGRVDKLTRAGAVLRAKNRELTRTLREADERVLALEARLADLQKMTTTRAAPPRRRKPVRPAAEPHAANDREADHHTAGHEPADEPPEASGGADMAEE